MTHARLVGDLAVRTNEEITLAFTVSNAGKDPFELRFRDGQAAEFVVREGGEPVWTWSEGRVFTQALWSEVIEPGGGVTFDARWSDPASGRYEAVATLAATNAELEARAPFTVPT